MTEEDKHVKDMMRSGIDDAFARHVAKLFDNWVLDDTQQPQRAARGLNKAIAIYREAAAAIEAWEG